MLWILASIGALLFGFVMFSKLQPDLPDELSFLKGKDPVVEVASTDDNTLKNLESIAGTEGATAGWTLRASGNLYEASREFKEIIKGPNGESFDRPEFAITCYNGHLYARINTRLSIAAPLAISGLPTWTMAANQNWYSANGPLALAKLKSLQTITTKLQFAEAGLQSFTLNLQGLSAVVGKMNGCHL